MRTKSSGKKWTEISGKYWTCYQCLRWSVTTSPVVCVGDCNVSSILRTSYALKTYRVEFKCVYRLWNAEFDSALECANMALQALAGGNDLKPYRSFWHHQSAVAAFLAFKATGKANYKTVAMQNLESASTTSLGIRSLGEVRAKLMGVPAVQENEVLPIREWFQNVNALLAEWGIRGTSSRNRYPK